jgi:CheY-like chemotaxis protein
LDELPAIKNESKAGTALQLKQFEEFNSLPKARPSILVDFDIRVPPTIIIADDDYLNRLALRTLIKLCNVDSIALTFLAENGLQTLNACKTFSLENFKLIFMDINMPQMDGLEATREIIKYYAENDAKPPVIVGLSGDVDEKMIAQGIEAGMLKVMHKPLRRGESG